MPVYDRFESVREITAPGGGWLVEARDTAVIALLERHGVVVRSGIAGARPLDIERFQLDSVERAERQFQGHREVTVQGHWVRARMLPSADWRWVPAAQRQLLVAAQILEPQSNDGATTWNLFDERLLMGKYHPVMRVITRLGVR
jgi:hypothetical protein